jgi:hypothetical protein
MKSETLRTTLGGLFLCGLLLAPRGGTQAATCAHPQGNRAMSPYGELNGTGGANVADAMCALLVVLWSGGGGAGSPPSCLAGSPLLSDLDCSGTYTVSDVQLLVQVALSGGPPAALDPDGDGCPTACEGCAPEGFSSCLIAGACLPEAAPSAGQPCQLCQPQLSEVSFTPAPDGLECGGGKLCQSGSCVAVLPGAPINVSAAAAPLSATVTWAAPPSNGGSPITDYVVRVFAANGGVATGVTGNHTRSVGAASTFLVFSGLSATASYRFSVAAVNAVGEGPQSALSQPLSPQCGASGDCAAGQVCVSGVCGPCQTSGQCGSGLVCQGGSCVPAAGCADGTREGLTNIVQFPNIAACGGTYTGYIDEGSADAICAPGWHVCRGFDAPLSAVNYTQATSFPGCFAFDAAHDCNACYPTCRGSVGVTIVCTVVNFTTDADMGGMGANCNYSGAGDVSCLASGRVDATTNTFGCGWAPLLTGVVCCRD